MRKHPSVDGNPHGFALASHQCTTDLTFRGFIRTAPQHLTGTFGHPSGPTGDGKVSGTFVFEDNRGCIVAIYDWKATSLYDDRPIANLPTVQEFWASEEPAEFSLAATGNIDLIKFARWIEATSIRLERVTQWRAL